MTRDFSLTGSAIDQHSTSVLSPDQSIHPSSKLIPAWVPPLMLLVCAALAGLAACSYSGTPSETRAVTPTAAVRAQITDITHAVAAFSIDMAGLNDTGDADPGRLPTPIPTPAPGPLWPEIDLSVSSPGIIEGQPVMIQWTVENAESVVLQPFGKVATSGRMEDRPNETRTYTIIAQNKSKTVQQSRVVFVFRPQDQPLPRPNAPKIKSFFIQPATVVRGEARTVQLSWDTEGATTVTISPGPGQVEATGIRNVPAPAQDTLYTLSARNNGGVTSTQRLLKIVEPPPPPPLVGVYSIRQQGYSRFVDVHKTAVDAFALVTRLAKDDDTPKWVLKYLGDNTYTIQQKSSGRYLDAHEVAAKDFALVTRVAQNNDSQKWVLKYLSGNTYTIQQKSSRKFVTAKTDFTLVLRQVSNDSTQRWILSQDICEKCDR